MEFCLPKKDDLKMISEFIARFNVMAECHIGYCGEDSGEIAQFLAEEMTDRPFYECFIVAKDAGNMVGVMGFDPDLERKVAEVWGPFVEQPYWDQVSKLWEQMMEVLPQEIEQVSMFFSKQNENCGMLADDLGFSKVSEQVILVVEDEDVLPLIVDRGGLGELSLEYHQEMVVFHDQVFPGTYYSGGEIIERMSDTRKVFICTENGMLTGYIYVEAVPEFGESSIEFFAVKESERGKGLGGRLLTAALKWIFSFDSIQSTTLCVNGENKQALRLYEKVGFKPKYELVYLVKDV